MAQIEDPAAQAKLDQPYRLILQLLIRTGLRINDALRVEVDCVVRDAQQAPYLRYYNHKMRREAFVPIDDELAAAIRAQQDAVLAQWPDATYLTPAPNSRDGRKARNTTGGSFTAITAWQEACGLHDELGRPFRFTAHQLRHTYGTRLINADVPQEVVRRLLDHESPEMTARYARLKDDTNPPALGTRTQDQHSRRNDHPGRQHTTQRRRRHYASVRLSAGRTRQPG